MQMRRCIPMTYGKACTSAYTLIIQTLTITTSLSQSSRATDIFCFRKQKDETLNIHRDRRKAPHGKLTIMKQTTLYILWTNKTNHGKNNFYDDC